MLSDLWSSLLETLDFEEVDRSFWICDCWGCEYGYDDTSAYRQQWLNKGALWFNRKKCSLNWNLEEQLKNIILNWDELRLKQKTIFG